MTNFKGDDDKRRNPDLVDNVSKEATENPKPRIVKVEVTPTQANLSPGDSVDVKISAQPANADLGEITGESDAEDVATVSGLTVTAQKVGAANVRFTDEGSGLGASILIDVFDKADEDEEGTPPLGTVQTVGEDSGS